MTDIITAQKIVAIAKDDGIGGGKNIVAGASVNITFVGGGIAPIFSDNLGTTPISLPNVTDANGEFAFFIKSGEYFWIVAGISNRVTVGIGGLPITLSDSGNMTISNTGTVVIQSAATSIKNVLTIDAPGNTAIVDLKGGGSGSNANGFMRIYSGDGTLASYVGHQGGVDYNAECQEGFSILSSQKTGARGLIAAGNGGAIVTPNGGSTKAVITLTAATGATDKATFEYDFTSTPTVSLKRLGTAYLTVSSDSLTQWTGAGTIAANYTPTDTTIFRNGSPRLAASATSTTIYDNSTVPAFFADNANTHILRNNIPVLSAGSGTTRLARGNGSDTIINADSTATVLRSPAANVLSATTTTTTIYAGNGAQAIAINSAGASTFSQSLISPTLRTNVAATAYDVDGTAGSGGSIGAGIAMHDSGSWVNDPAGAYASTTLTFAFSAARIAQISLEANGQMYCRALHTTTANQWHAVWDSVNAPDLMTNPTFSGNATAANFYGNGFNLTQLNASNVVNGTLPSNIFPATISAASITFSGGVTVKSGTLFNIIEATGSNVTLRDYLGNTTFFANGTDLNLKRANNIVLNASATATQLFNHAGSIRANFDASSTQIFAPSGAPFISATTSTAAITSGNGASCIEIDSTGAATMVHREFLVSTKPSAAANARRAIIITDATLGYGLYISDGTNWRNAGTGAIQA